MALVTGNDGTVKYGATPTELSTESWNISMKGSVRNMDSSANAGDYSIKAPGAFKDWSGSFTVLLDDAVALPEENAQVALELYTTSAKKYSGNAIITEVGPTIEVKGGDGAKVTVNFEGTGTLTKPATS